MEIFPQRNTAVGLYFNQIIFCKNLTFFTIKSIALGILFCLLRNIGWSRVPVAIGNTIRNSFSVETCVKSAPSDYFRSKNSGGWSSISTWESSADNINWIDATEIPTEAANAITIQGGHTVNVKNPVSLDQTIVAGVLELLTGGVLNINDGDGDDITIPANGILRIISTDNYSIAVNQSANATINIATDGKITIGDGSASIGDYFENFATSPVNVWNTGSVYEYNSNSTFAASGVIYFPNAGTNIPVFRVTNVDGTPGGGASNPTTINGILEVNKGFTFISGGIKTFRNGIRGTSTLTQDPTCGNFIITGADAVLDGPSLNIMLNSPLYLETSVSVPDGANIAISGGNIDNNITGNVLTVNGTLDVTTIKITNTAGSVIVNGTYKTANTGGFSGTGSSIPSGFVTVNPTSTIELYSTGDQSLHSRTDFANLIFSGNGIKTPLGTFSPHGTITIRDDAVLDCTGKNIGDASTNLTMTDDSRLIVSTVGTNPAMTGTYNLTGGVIEFANNSGTAQTIRPGTYQDIVVSGSNVANSNGIIRLNPSGAFKVKTGAVFTINADCIKGSDGSETVTVESGGIFRSGNNQGFNGFTTASTNTSSINANITNINLQPGSTVEYIRNGDQPITNANSLEYSNLTLSGTGNKTAPSGVLTINGDLSKTSGCVFVHNNGTVVFNGTTAQSYSSVSPQVVFNNLTNNNKAGLSLEDSLSVYKELLLGTASQLNLNGNITLLSDGDNTASIAPIPVDAVIDYLTGSFIVERYIPGHFKAWQFLAISTKGSTVKESWQENNDPGENVIPGYGTQITSNLPGATSLGFDQSSAGPSMKTYDLLTNSWVGISGTSMNIENVNGYMLFVRGDRSVTTVNQAATSTILRTEGKLYAPGSEAPSDINIPANSFQSIGNPYASAIDFSRLGLSGGVTNAYYIWDPQLTTGPNSAYGYGGYRTISGTAVVPSSGNYIDGSPPSIQSGQAFFVYAADAGTVSFSEDSKVAGSASLFKPVMGLADPDAQLRVNLKVITNNDPVLVDGILMQFDHTYSDDINAWDVIKKSNSGEQISIKSYGKQLTIERCQMVQADDTLIFSLGKLKQQSYQFEFIATHLERYGMEAFLEDSYLNTKIPLNLSGTTLINFAVDSKASAASNRFHVIFSPSAGPLQVTFTSVKAYQKDTKIMVAWKVENETDLSHYEVEKSADGNRFITARTEDAKNLVAGNYQWIDANPLNGYNYYRIKSADINGRIKYSRIVRVYMGKEKPSISVYPNPLSGGDINLQLINQPAGRYKVKLLNSFGQAMLTKQINHNGGSSLHSIYTGPYLPHGIYQLEVMKPGGEKSVVKMKN